MTTTKLYYKSNEFIEEKNIQLPGSECALLEINTDKKELKLTFYLNISFVDKKIAERQAQSISKTGFLLSCGERVGSGCSLIIISQEPVIK